MSKLRFSDNFFSILDQDPLRGNLGQASWKWSFDPDSGINVWKVDALGDPHHEEVYGIDYWKYAQGRIYENAQGQIENMIWSNRGNERDRARASIAVNQWTLENLDRPVSRTREEFDPATDLLQKQGETDWDEWNEYANWRWVIDKNYNVFMGDHQSHFDLINSLVGEDAADLYSPLDPDDSNPFLTGGFLYPPDGEISLVRTAGEPEFTDEEIQAIGRAIVEAGKEHGFELHTIKFSDAGNNDRRVFRVANIMDPIQSKLDQAVFEGQEVRPEVAEFITNEVDLALTTHGFDPQDFDLYLTGSLTTYQYSGSSDCDVSVFPLWDRFEQDHNSLRKTLVAMVINELDGVLLPGTTHPIQHFVNSVGSVPEDRFQRGVRSGYNLRTREWLVPPERDRAHDVALEYPDIYTRAVEMADKMRDALDHDPATAKELFHQIHMKRTLDEESGLGDFSEGNITYKWLLHEGLFDRIREELGVYIAKEAYDEGPELERLVGGEQIYRWNGEERIFDPAYGEGVRLVEGDSVLGSLTWEDRGDHIFLATTYMQPDARGAGHFRRMFDYMTSENPGKPVASAALPGNFLRDVVHRYNQRIAGVPPIEELSPHRYDAECYEVAHAVANQWPHLEQDSGFYIHPERGIGDHGWNIGPDGTIVDMTAKQHDYAGPDDENSWDEESAPDHPEIVPSNHPFYDRYVSWTRHPEKAQLLAHECGYHEGDPSPACPSCSPTIVTANGKHYVHYNFDADHITLGKTSDTDDPHNIVVGEYWHDTVLLYPRAHQWFNPNYFRRLWHHSFPTKTMTKVVFENPPPKVSRGDQPKYVQPFIERLYPHEIHNAGGECINPKCDYVLTPLEQDEVARTGQFDCSRCGYTYDYEAENMNLAGNKPGGRTRAAITMKQMGDIGEGIISDKLKGIPGVGEVVWLSSDYNDPIDMIIGDYACEVKTNHSEAQPRFKLGDSKERNKKIQKAAELGLKQGFIGVRLNFYTDKADVFFRPQFSDYWIGQPGSQHIATVDFDDLNPFMSPDAVPPAQYMPDDDSDIPF